MKWERLTAVPSPLSNKLSQLQRNSACTAFVQNKLFTWKLCVIRLIVATSIIVTDVHCSYLQLDLCTLSWYGSLWIRSPSQEHWDRNRTGIFLGTIHRKNNLETPVHLPAMWAGNKLVDRKEPHTYTGGGDAKFHTERNPSSGSDQGTWSCEAVQIQVNCLHLYNLTLQLSGFLISLVKYSVSVLFGIGFMFCHKKLQHVHSYLFASGNLQNNNKVSC